ncbi:MAG: DNA repair protein RadA, partial [Burkholderiales bacterium]
MAKVRTQYVCSECGGTSPKGAGRCPHCGAWNTLQEGVVEPPRAAAAGNRFAPLAASGGVQWLDQVV